MRSLVIAQEFPWPLTSGSLLRLDTVMSALADLGEVELFSVVNARREAPCIVPDGAPVTRSATATFRDGDYSPMGRAAWAVSRLPLELGTLDLSEPAAQLADWARPPYDVVWFSKAMTYVGLGRANLGPAVVDLDDLEDHKILARLRSDAFADAYPPTPSGRLHRGGAAIQGRHNAQRWSRIQREISGEVEAVVVCSEVDQERLGVHNSWIVPNGYDAPAEPVGKPAVNTPPVLLFQGLLPYAPNTDGAKWLVNDVLPLLRQRVPGVELRLVGAVSAPIRRLAHPPEVRVTGRVPAMLPELAKADIVTVPVRYGSGTRVKILEAFAHRIPVVSTTPGAEGLGAEHGRHLLLADTAQSFADACEELLTDVGLRVTLTEAAHQLLIERHQWTRARTVINDMALAVARQQPAER